LHLGINEQAFVRIGSIEADGGVTVVTRTVMKLPSPTEYYQPVMYRAYWVARSRYGLSSRKPLGPSGVPVTNRAHGCDSVGDPLVGFSAPSRYVPKVPASHLST
jgi:hypothetical protein